MSTLNLCMLFALLSATMPLLATTESEIKLLSTDDNGLTLSFTPVNWESTTHSFNGGEFALLVFSGSQPSGKVGAPQIPVKFILVGIPLNGSVTATLIDASFEEVTTKKILPVPHLVKDDMGLMVEHYTADNLVYSSNEPVPNSLFELTEPAFFRNQRIVKLILKPLQYLPKSGILRKYSKLTVRIHFSGTPGSPPGNYGEASDEQLYHRLLVNYQQSKEWRKKRDHMIRKRTQVMSEGPWYKIHIEENGLHKVEGSRLKNAGIDLFTIEPRTIRIYNNGGRELPRELEENRPDSLIENPIIVSDDGDNRFDESDYLLFYGKSVSGWKYDTTTSAWSHYINNYTSENIYWLTWGYDIDGKRMGTVPSASAYSVREVTSFRDRLFFEEDINNPFHGGFHWFGRKFDNTSLYRDFSIALPGAQPADSAAFSFQFVALSPGSHRFEVFINSYPAGASTILNSGSGTYPDISVRQLTSTSTNLINPGLNTIGIRHSGTTPISEGFIDWFEIEFSRSLTASGDELLIYTPPVTELLQYSASGFSSNTIYILDVSEFFDIKRVEPLSITSGTAAFADYSRVPDGKRYYLCTPNALRTPLRIEQDVASALRTTEHNAELIIICHDDFYSQALQLKSLRETWNPGRIISTEVVKISDIYDEFSWGLYDATAIRDFIAYAFENWGMPLQYVVLFGDGDFDYRNIVISSDNNWIPPYQSLDSSSTASRTTDDWYVFVSGNDDEADLSIGRLPVTTSLEAQQVVDKIIRYETQPVFGDWHNCIAMVADDEFGQYDNEIEHTRQVEEIAEETLPESFDIRKVYLVEYPAVSSPSISGIVKPAATEDLINQINRGTLIVNFIGHGNSQLWAHERVLNAPTDFDKIQNGDMYGFWIAATCDFARFDDPYEQSLAEELVTVDKRGAIGVLSSTRLAYSGLNYAFNSRFLHSLFVDYSANGTVQTIGEALLYAKLSGDPVNNEKYTLLGDPTLLIAAPRYKAIIESVEPDSFQALALTTVQGHLEKDGAVWNEFNGHIRLIAYDTRKPQHYTAEAGGVVDYILPGNIIFRGTSSVSNGRFKGNFIVPKDISYGGEEGRLSVYFWSMVTDGAGFMDNIHVGGTGAAVADNVGPLIDVDFSGENFASGEFTDTNPVVHVEICDSLSGVNLAGEIGHNITLVIDEDSDNRKDVTDFFNYYEGSYISGFLDYPLIDLQEGWHIVEIRAWDNSNNSSEMHAEFQVVSDQELVLSEVLNYPNPMHNSTEFTFFISRDAEVTIKIYTVAGRLLKTISVFAERNFNSVAWDGRDEEGDSLGNGVYLYKVVAKASGLYGEMTSVALGKLIVMN